MTLHQLGGYRLVKFWLDPEIGQGFVGQLALFRQGMRQLVLRNETFLQERLANRSRMGR